MSGVAKKLLRIVLLGRGSAETCPACGEKFECGATIKGCWCSEVKLSEAAREEMKAKYKGCLCRTCLEKFAESEARKQP